MAMFRQLSFTAKYLNKRKVLDKREFEAKPTTKLSCDSILHVRLKFPIATSTYQVCYCQRMARKGLRALDTPILRNSNLDYRNSADVDMGT